MPRRTINRHRCACGLARPYFGHTGLGRATCCKRCKKPGMVDVKNKRCDCGLAIPYFGYPGSDGQKRATHCARCKAVGMVNVRGNRCRCGSTAPRFGWPHGRVECCAKCKDQGMVNLRTRRCSCGKAEPSFGHADGVAVCCKLCRHPGMTNVRAKKCHGCTLAVPSFGRAGTRIATHCTRCRTDDMVNVTGKRCHCGSATPYFGYHDGPATHCKRCKKTDMTDVRSRKCSCGRARPQYGTQGGTATHCFVCKEKNMVNVKEKFCTDPLNLHHTDGHPNTIARFHHKAEWLCWGCWMHKTGSSGHKPCRAVRREHIFLGQLLTHELPQALGLSPLQKLHEYYHDRSVLSCHTICRPDLTFVLPNFLVVVEFDESGHVNRTSLSELQHLEIVRVWARDTHGLQFMYVLRIDERGLFRKTYTGGHTGNRKQPRELVWTPTTAFPQCIRAVAGRLRERIVQAMCPSGRIPPELQNTPLATQVETWNRTLGIH
jgi:hypothetical protein